ncbi:transporter substrate-binding domain-containing protein [Undibacterium sp. CY18W]|uniref:Transporter substrate-binding domain-containing protein n=1 Tax=Undibacterium hunanense TaxID=2762292 RepID=A0ABR6ZL27_9BURK|nr:transporter substrate-binding domain-containing protein [Undibacterium hunanense]MBC3916259.1 transporter substrate-binding domain-containing protein [Undibacterium hunanense]
MRLLLFLVLVFVLSAAGAAERVRACGGESNWPPMSYVKTPGAMVEGLSADVLRSILNDPKIELRPWARCLLEVQAREGFDIVMSVFRTPEREKIFLFSRSYHSLTPSYLYAATRFQTPPLQLLSDLEKFKICSLHGSSTFYTKLPASAIESGATSYVSLLRKIERGHCDIVVDMQEVLWGFARLGLLPLDMNAYRIVNLPQTEKYALHFGVSRSHPQALLLIDQLDKGLAELQRSGRLAGIISKYQ